MLIVFFVCLFHYIYSGDTMQLLGTAISVNSLSFEWISFLPLPSVLLVLHMVRLISMKILASFL